VKKPYQIVTRAAKESAAVVEQFCQSNGQILLPIVTLIESASEVVENVIHEIQIHALETILFLVQGIHFNAQFAAPNRELFDQHLPHAMEALGTIAPLPQSEASATRAPAEELAWYKRYAFLLQKLGDRNNARALAKEGLAKFPSDAELLKLAQ